MSDRQITAIEETRERIEQVETQIEEIEHKDNADREQLQALEAAKRDLKRAGAHVGRSGANRYTERAQDRLDGIEATVGL